MAITQPTFHWNFNDLTLTDRVNGVPIEFTRTGDTCTRCNSLGFLEEVTADDTPRFHYSPGGAFLGILSERARSNFIYPSNDFTARWAAPGLDVTPNQAIGPDGTLSLHELRTDNASSSQAGCRIQSGASNMNSVPTAIASAWIMDGVSTGWMYLKVINNVPDAYCFFDMTNEVFGATTGADVIATYYEDWGEVAPGLKRVVMVYDGTLNDGFGNLEVGLADGDNDFLVQRNGDYYFYCGFVQYEQDTSTAWIIASTYIPTTNVGGIGVRGEESYFIEDGVLENYFPGDTSAFEHSWFTKRQVNPAIPDGAATYAATMQAFGGYIYVSTNDGKSITDRNYHYRGAAASGLVARSISDSTARDWMPNAGHVRSATRFAQDDVRMTHCLEAQDGTLEAAQNQTDGTYDVVDVSGVTGTRFAVAGRFKDSPGMSCVAELAMWANYALTDDELTNIVDKSESIPTSSGGLFIAGTQVTGESKVRIKAVAEDYAGEATDVYIKGTRHTVDGFMCVTGTAPSGDVVFINGIAHNPDNGVRYVQTETFSTKVPGGFSTDSDGRQALTSLTPVVYNAGLGTQIDGSLSVG